MATFASGYKFCTACAITWDAVWRRTARPFSSFAVRIFSSQSLSRTVRRSTTSPFTSPAHAARARPSLMSYAISITDLASEYSFFEPSFNVIIMIVSPFVFNEFLWYTVHFPVPEIFSRKILWSNFLRNKKIPYSTSRTVRDEFIHSRGSTLLALLPGHARMQSLSIMMITESPDRIGATRR